MGKGVLTRGEKRKARRERLLKKFGRANELSRDDDTVEHDNTSVWSTTNGKYVLAHQTCDELPSGMYTCYVTMDGNRIFKEKEFNTDKLIVLEDSPSSKILKEIQKFWEIEDRFRDRGFLHKRGFLLSGPPGGGKSSTINLIVQSIVNDHDGIAVYIQDPTMVVECMQDFRKAEPDRPLVGIIEDIDDLIDRYGETIYLSLLDGECQIDNIVFVATTNNPEKLKDRIVKRPSRFDSCVYIDMPNAEVRERFLRSKEESLTDDEIEHWVELSHGLSIAHLKEMIILNKCFDVPIEEAVSRLTDIDLTAEHMEYEDKKKTPMGFNFNKEKD